MIPVSRLNHAVLYVTDVPRSVRFYQEAFGFELVAEVGQVGAAFLRAAGSGNHHDLGLFPAAARRSGGPGAVGLYHLAWEVPAITDLVSARDILGRMGALVGESDHGATKSVYGVDPDGHEFEVMWLVPREQWGEDEHAAPVRPLDLAAEVERHA